MNRKGLTILEVLASVIILAFAIVLATYIFQQSSLFSRDNQKVEQSLLVTRTVLEEIKQNLRLQDTISVYSQSINLKVLRDSNPPFQLPAAIFYPDNTNQLYKIEIQSVAIGNNNIQPPTGAPIDINKYFRRIQITTTDLLRNKSIQLESYVERE